MAAGPMLDETAARELRSRFRGQLIQPGEAGYDTARRIDNAMIDRRPGVDRPLRRGVRRDGRGGDRAKSGADRLGTSRRPQRRRQRRLRRRRHDRPVADEGGAGRPGRAHRPGGARGDLGRLRSRDAAVRPRLHRRGHLQHGDRWPHAGRRGRLAQRPLRARLRQPDRGGCAHRGRPPPARERARERGSLLGPPGRRRQFRHRDLLRVPAAPPRPDGPRGPGLPPRFARPGRPAPLPRADGGGARRADHVRWPLDRVPMAHPWSASSPATRARPSRARSSSPPCASSARRRSTRSVPCPTWPSSACSTRRFLPVASTTGSRAWPRRSAMSSSAPSSSTWGGCPPLTRR